MVYFFIQKVKIVLALQKISVIFQFERMVAESKEFRGSPIKLPSNAATITGLFCKVKDFIMAKYIKKTFSPHIYKDWIHLFKQCSVEQRAELLLAITDYPNYEPSINIPVWEFIKSQLDAQYQKTEQKSQTLSNNRNKSQQKSTEVNQEEQKSTEVNKCSQIEIEIETGIENKRDSVEKKNLVRGAFTPPTLEQVLKYAKQMHECRDINGFYCSKDMAERFYLHYETQNWMLGNGNHMTNWQVGLKKWAFDELKKQKDS